MAGSWAVIHVWPEVSVSLLSIVDRLNLWMAADSHEFSLATYCSKLLDALFAAL